MKTDLKIWYPTIITQLHRNGEQDTICLGKNKTN